jgi:prefoldin subunit 5
MTISNLTVEQINVVLLYLQKQIDELRSIIESMNS